MNAITGASGITAWQAGKAAREKSEIRAKPAEAKPPVEQKPVKDISAELEARLSEANREMAQSGTKIIYDVHKETNVMMFRLVDADSGEVIREVPSEKVLDMLAYARERFGLMVDRKI